MKVKLIIKRIKGGDFPIWIEEVEETEDNKAKQAAQLQWLNRHLKTNLLITDDIKNVIIAKQIAGVTIKAEIV